MDKVKLIDAVSRGSHARNTVDPELIIGDASNGYDQGDILDANSVQEKVEDIQETIDGLDNVYAPKVENGYIENPDIDGVSGQILSLDSHGNTVWSNPTEGSITDSTMSDISENPVQNKTIKAYVDSTIYDISVNHPTSGVDDGNTYASLSAALAVIPQDKQKGGMTVRYIQSSDNKYVQYMCKKSIWSSTPTDWESTASSGDVKYLSSIKAKKDWGVNLCDNSKNLLNSYFDGVGNILGAVGPFRISPYIPVMEQDIITNGWTASNTIASYVVYDINFRKIRVSTLNAQYTYQSGDYYIRFCNNTTLRCNFGTTLEPYKDYTETAKIDSLQSQINDLSNNKVDVIVGTNLINPDTVTIGKYFDIAGILYSGTNDYAVSDYIPVNGQNIASSAAVGSFFSSFVVYDANKNKIRNSYNVTSNYTYQSGDAYVRFGFRFSSLTTRRANYGDTLQDYVPYTNYAPVQELDKRINAFAPNTETLTAESIPNYLYNVYNDIKTSRNYALKVYLSHLLSISQANKNIVFDNGERFLSFAPPLINSKQEVSKTISLPYNSLTINTKLRTSKASGTANVTPKVLVIGDSVSAGYGATSNRNPTWYPATYWAIARMLFKLDSIDAEGGHNIVFTGLTILNNTIEYNGQTYSSRSGVVAQGGKALNDLFTDNDWGYNSGNPFYDSIGNTFSIKAYLDKYRTMDDAGVRLVTASPDPHGETVTGSDGNTYVIGSLITSQSLLSSYDVCTPDSIIINLNHNTSLENYQSYIDDVISIIRTELGSTIKIALMVIDEAGTLFPKDYPNYISSEIGMGTLHTKNAAIYNYIKEYIEDESNNVFLLGAQFTQPTAKGLPTLEYVEDDSFLHDVKDESMFVLNPSVLGANYHPNNIAHTAFGYCLYSFLKYIFQ